MFINISSSYLLVRSIETGKSLPAIDIISDERIRISGLANNPTVKKKKGIFTAAFVLREATSVVIIVDGFSVYLMNADTTVTCFISNKTNYFRIIQSGKEKLSDYSPQGYYYAFTSIGQITVETDDEKETDKHVRIG